MSADFTVKNGDTKPDLTATLLDVNGAAVNLTGATVRLNMKKIGASALKIDNVAVTVVSAAAGTVKYVWTAPDTDTSGIYNAEFEVTFGDGTILTFPNDGYFTVEITPEVG